MEATRWKPRGKSQEPKTESQEPRAESEERPKASKSPLEIRGGCFGGLVLLIKPKSPPPCFSLCYLSHEMSCG